MDIASAFKKIKIVYEEYQRQVPGGFTTQTSAFWMQKVIGEYTGTTINVKQVDWNPVQIKGRIDRYQNSADIIISSRLNYCWTKFVGFKEMSHLVIDTFDGSVGGNSCVSSVDQTTSLIAELISSVDAGGAARSPQYLSEVVAVHCAIELMFPISQRVTAAKRLREGNPNTTIHSLAVEYRMPKHYVELSLSDRYIEVLGRYALDAEAEVRGNPL